MTTRSRVFVPSQPFVAYDNGEPKIRETRVTIRVDEDIFLSLREYYTPQGEAE
jgi:hypothetical protein